MPFGSFESNFYTPWGDLDLSLELPVLEDQAPAVPKSRKVKILRSIERALLKSGTRSSHLKKFSSAILFLVVMSLTFYFCHQSTCLCMICS